MMSNIRKFFTTLKMGIKGAWTHRSMGIASIFSIFATLVILALVLIITVSANSVVEDMQGKVDEVEIFISDRASPREIDDLEEEIKKDENVKSVEYRSSEEALELMKKSWGKNADILEGVNVLPASYLVRLNDINLVDEFVRSMEKHGAVDEINYFQDIVGKVSKIKDIVQTGGLVLTILLLLVSIFIISNTIKLTVYARGKEISVMKHVGATNHMIRRPFIIEGFIFGLIGSLLAYLLVIKAYEYLYINYSQELYNIVSSYMLRPEILNENLRNIFLAIGIGIGVVGSTFSMRKYLKV